MSTETLTHKNLGELCGVSVTTIKSYRKKFGGFIPVATQGKPIRFLPEAGPVCLRIRDSFAEGLSIEETRKRLRAEFKEIETEREPPKSDDPAVSAATAGAPVSGEYLEQFFKTAGQMMQGMAQLATAQARADQRLSRLEKALTGLLESGAATQDALGELIEQTRQAPTTEGRDGRVRARKIVSVHGAEGRVDTYSFDAEPDGDERPDAPGEPTERPDEDFLTFPVAVHSERGEFLGVPGRLSLGEFAELLLEQSGDNANSLWREAGGVWAFVLTQGDGQRNELFFERTKTPRGNDVALLGRLDVDGRETSHAFLLEFFRQVKDRMRRDT